MKNQAADIQKTAFMVTAAAILQVAESFFPQVVPGVKLGLANMIVLIAIVNLGIGPALEIAVMRTLISSLVLGTFLSPAFILSLSSAVTSALAMGLAYRFFRTGNRPVFSLIGMSIIGAIIHNLTQISLVYLILIKTTGIFMLLPWLGISSVVTGWLTGMVASQVCRRLDSRKKPAFSLAPLTPGRPGFKMGGKYVEGGSVMHRLPAVAKITGVTAIAALLVIFQDLRVYAAVTLAIMAAIAASGIRVSVFFEGIKRIYFFIVLSFAMPMFFTTSGHVLFSAGALNITGEGLSAGAAFAARLMLLMTSAAVLMKTTAPSELAKGIKTLLEPFRFTGISGDRVSAIAASSLAAMPAFWDKARAYINGYRKKNTGAAGAVMALSAFIAFMYMSAEQDTL